MLSSSECEGPQLARGEPREDGGVAGSAVGQSGCADHDPNAGHDAGADTDGGNHRERDSATDPARKPRG